MALLGPIFALDGFNKTSEKNNLLDFRVDISNFKFILAPKKLKIGDIISNEGDQKQRSLKETKTKEFLVSELEKTYTKDQKVGDSLPLYIIPLGASVHNIEIQPGAGGKLVRSAGTNSKVIEKNFETGYARLSLPSGCHRWIPLICKATLGDVGNEDWYHTKLGKAGAKRWRGRRPKVRGVAMNPVDHPHGGGEGRTSGGRPSVTPWGRPTRSYKNKKRKMNPFLLRIKD